MAVKHNNSTQEFEDISAASILSVIFGYSVSNAHTPKPKRVVFLQKIFTFYFSHGRKMKYLK